MWQQLYDELKDKGFMVVAVAEESRGADHARPWIEQAKSSYWQLIDTEHRLSDLYNLVNVPQAIWIDEKGRIARPPETAGSTDHFRRMDLKTRTMSPEDQAERLAARQAYLDAVRNWVRTGRHAMAADTARASLPRVTPEIAEARARFRLGVWLRRHGRAAEGDRQMAEASRLYPESWSMWRQAADLDEVGKASGPEFWARVRALGDKPYYPPPKV
ncbi:MAG: TlpA family protein disulfide reductase [Proteobacteria bacterium]|nr:TlpA family protein disulfide reductase [Pseudomonadota bacterium]